MNKKEHEILMILRLKLNEHVEEEIKIWSLDEMIL